MIRHLFVLGLLALTACLENHPGNAQVVKQADCYTCHINEYNATGVTEQFPAPIPVHKTSSCSTDCVQCHTTQTWVNSLGGCVHPEQKFPLASMGTKHTGIACTDCHKPELTTATVTSVGGGNTDCITCHPNTTTQAQNHVGVTYDSGTLVGTAYSYKSDQPNFCLVCHPNGLAAGHGPSNPFILPHHGAACATCHDGASGLGHTGGADVLCVTSGCHGDAHHKDTNHHPGCLASGCHPDGRSHGG